jgi:transcriptional regulator with XRE-family HTH domain
MAGHRPPPSAWGRLPGARQHRQPWANWPEVPVAHRHKLAAPGGIAGARGTAAGSAIGGVILLLPANRADGKIRNMGEEADSTEERAVGKRIAAARKRKRLLQADLARQLGLNQQRISSWENGEELPNTPSRWRDLCDALGVSSDYLLFGRTAGLSDEAIFKGWEEVNTDHYEADLGELGKISVTYDPTAGHWTAWAFGTARPGHPTAAEAQAVAVRMVREESAFAGNRLDGLKPST